MRLTYLVPRLAGQQVIRQSVSECWQLRQKDQMLCCFVLFCFVLMCVIVRVPIALKRHQDQGNSYKGQHLIGAGLHVQRFSRLSSRWEHSSIQAGVVQVKLRVLHLQHTSEGSKKTGFQAVRMKVLQPTPTMAHLLQQCHTYSNTATYTPTRPHLQKVLLPGLGILKSPQMGHLYKPSSLRHLYKPFSL